MLRCITSVGVFWGDAKVTSVMKFRVLSLTSCLTLPVSYLSPLARQNFPALLKIEQSLSHR